MFKRNNSGKVSLTSTPQTGGANPGVAPRPTRTRAANRTTRDAARAARDTARDAAKVARKAARPTKTLSADKIARNAAKAAEDAAKNTRPTRPTRQQHTPTPRKTRKHMGASGTSWKG